MSEYFITVQDAKGRTVQVPATSPIAVGDHFVLTQDATGRTVAVSVGAGWKDVSWYQVSSPGYPGSFPTWITAPSSSGTVVVDEAGTQYFKEIFFELNSPVADGGNIYLSIYGSRNGRSALYMLANTTTEPSCSFTENIYGIDDDTVDYSTLTWGTRPAGTLMSSTLKSNFTPGDICPSTDLRVLQLTTINAQTPLVRRVTNTTGSTIYGIRLTASMTTEGTRSYFAHLDYLDIAQGYNMPFAE